MKKITTLLILLICLPIFGQNNSSKVKQKQVSDYRKTSKKTKNTPVKKVNYSGKKTRNKRPKWDKKPEKL